MRKISAVLIFSGMAAIASGCSHSGSNGTLPSTNAGVQHFTSLPTASAERVRIREFSNLPQYSGLYGPSSVAAAFGSLWVTEVIDQDYGENAVIQIAPSGKALNAFYYPGQSTQGSSFVDITPGPDGALWITDEYNEQIVRLTTAGAYTGFLLKNYTTPYNIANGPDRALWFTAYSPTTGPAIGRITTSGRITVYSAPASVLDITSGPDGALWFTEPSSDKVGRITVRGKIKEYAKGITAGSQPYSIAAGPDGALWFTERTGGRIGRITTAGTVTEYSQGITSTEQPFDLAAGLDGAMWFTEYETYGSYQVRAAKIGRIAMNGNIHEYSKGLDPKAGPTAITLGSDSRLWFVESSADRTGRVTP